MKRILHASAEFALWCVNKGQKDCRCGNIKALTEVILKIHYNLCYVHILVNIYIICVRMDIWTYDVLSVSMVWCLSHLSHSLQPSISEPGCSKALCSFTWAFVASVSRALSPLCLKIEKRHKAGYCSFSLGYWFLAVIPLLARMGMKTTKSSEPSNTRRKHMNTQMMIAN